MTNSKVMRAVTVAAVTVLTGYAAAADLDLADAPLFTAASVDPNIMFLIDTSGSMSNIVPDDPYSASTTYNCTSTKIPAGDQIDILISSAGAPSFEHVEAGKTYSWSASGTSGRCFDPSKDYMARLFGQGGNGKAKSPDSYLPAQYSGNYLNWYFSSSPTNWGTDAHSKRLPIPTSAPYSYALQRIDIAKTAATNLISSLDDTRVGLASYNGDKGGTINVGINDLTSTQRSAMAAGIDDLAPVGSTPLAESLQDIGRYFVGENNPQYDGNLILHPGQTNQSSLDDDTVFNHSPVYSKGVSKASPIQYFCQQNFAVLLTDGRPQSDQGIAASTGLTDYDGDCSGSSAKNCDTYDRKKDQEYESAGSDYLDDVALALKDIDLRPDLDDAAGAEVNNSISTYTIGFADDQVIGDPLMQDTADNGDGSFLQAANASQLAGAFQAAALNIIQKRESAASSATFNMGSARSGSQVYQAKFKNKDWSGQLLGLRLHDGVIAGNGCSASDTVGKLCPNPVWDAGCVLTGGQCAATGATVASPNYGTTRQILTFNPSNTSTPKGVSFAWANLNATQQAALDKSATGAIDTRGSDRVTYLRGTRTQEQSYSSGIFRTRTSLLGDIAHSSPIYVGPPSRLYPVTWIDKLSGATPENTSGAQTYQQFKTAYRGRMSMVYAGANDGFLHGFESGTYDASGNLLTANDDGKELLAYMPSKALLNARYLTYPNYTHRNYVDSTPVENDVFFSNAWHTVLVGGLGGGGQGVYALNISNPGDSAKTDPTFTETNAGRLALWEFTDQSTSGADLGYTFSQPVIVRLHNGRWGVVVGNGYNNTAADGYTSTTGNAVLYILDMETGSVLQKLDTNVGTAQDPTAKLRPNGLASVFPVDQDGDLITDYVYAGDLFGNIWRFDLTSTSASNWKVSEFGGTTAKPNPLFTAKDASSNPQPITTRVQVGAHPNYGVSRGAMVYFGTGKYMENGDAIPNTAATQTFYGVWDKDFSTSGSLSRSTLQQQQIDAVTSASGNIFRRVTNNAVDYTTKRGWYLDLKLAGGSNQGEMVIADPVIRGKAVVFTTLIPDGRTCVGGGTGFLMVIDQASGGRTSQSPFDVSPEYGKFTTADYVTFSDGSIVAASGTAIAGTTPGFVLAGDTDHALIQQFDGTIAEKDLNVGTVVKGRRIWRQLR